VNPDPPSFLTLSLSGGRGLSEVVRTLLKLAELHEEVGKMTDAISKVDSMLSTEIYLCEDQFPYYKFVVAQLDEALPAIAVSVDGVKASKPVPRKVYVVVKYSRLYITIKMYDTISVCRPTLRQLLALAEYEKRYGLLSRLVEEVKKREAEIAERLEKLKSVVAILQVALA
jgi:hypothetical protein